MMKNQQRGSIALITAALFYGFYGIFSRLIGSSFGNFNQSWIRNVIVVVLITFVIIINKTKLISFQKKDIKWIILWFMSGSWLTVLTFIAFNNLPIGTTYLVLYSAMIISGFLSGAVFFKEKITSLKMVSLILSLVGLFIIYRFSISPDKFFYVFLVLISGFMIGIWNTISKKFSDHYHNNQIVLMDAVSTVIAVFIGSIIFKERLPQTILSISWVWIGLYAVIQTLNVGLIVYGFKNVEAQIGSTILPIEIIFATFFAYLIFHEVPGPLLFIGGVFIILAAIIPSLSYFRLLKKSEAHF
ncbi:MAG: DMT family transporter [bacterium]|nr:DMT family transporter [bacterium]